MPPSLPVQDEHSQRDGFGRLARLYRWLEYLTFGPWLALCRNARLRDVSVTAARHALILGDGDGRFLARLLRQNPGVGILSVDSSPAMLDRQSRRAARDGNASRLTIHCEDIRCFTPAADYDLVITHFCLDCLSTTEIEALARRLRLRMAPGACWIVSDFALPDGAARIPAQIVIRSLYLAFRIITGLQTRTLPDHAEALRSAGFVLLDRRTWLAGLLMSEQWRPPAGASTKPLTC